MLVDDSVRVRVTESDGVYVSETVLDWLGVVLREMSRVGERVGRIVSEMVFSLVGLIDNVVVLDTDTVDVAALDSVVLRKHVRLIDWDTSSE